MWLIQEIIKHYENNIYFLMTFGFMCIGQVQAADYGRTIYYSPYTNSDYVSTIVHALWNCCKGRHHNV